MATKKKSPPRKTKKFQLRMNNAQDIHCEEVLNYWRSNKKQVTNIRNAITLYHALEQGSLEALYEMFPTYKGQFGINEIKSLLQQMTVVPTERRLPALEAPKAVVVDVVAKVDYDQFLDAFR